MIEFLPKNFPELIKLGTLVIAAVGFFWGVIQWKLNQSAEREQRTYDESLRTENRRIEATKPFLERQLKLYTEASAVVATIGTSTNKTEVEVATDRFWKLYWGELALVENNAVEEAMAAFGKSLQEGDSQSQLKHLSLVLAHQCRESLDSSWGVRAWTKDRDDDDTP